jgi:phage terminase small subunit
MVMNMNKNMPPGQNIWDFNGSYLTRQGCRQWQRGKSQKRGGGNAVANKYTREYDEYTKSEEYQNIKKDLLDQLDRNGTVGQFYIDLVNDYMGMWVTKKLLNDDIYRKGIKVKYNNGGGQTGWKKNDSIDQARQVNVQMLKLLSELGIKPSSGGEDDEL